MANTKALRTSIWVGSTYFIEGLPYMIVRFLSSVFFTDIGVREAYLGFLNFLGIPWNLKFLWAPFLDIFGTKRSWMLKIQLLITLLTFVVAFLAGIYADTSSQRVLPAIGFIFVCMAFIAATNDIAIDSYYLEGLSDPTDQAAYSGLRILTYRLAVIYSRSFLVAVAGVANWFWGFTAGALTMLLFTVLHKVFLPHFEQPREKTPKPISFIAGEFAEAFWTYVKHDRIIVALAFAATYKLGDEILFSMNTPFLMRELGVTKLQLSWLAGIVGVAATIFGSLLGAWWIKKAGLKKAIWPITVFMNVNILAYLLLAYMKPDASTTGGITFIALIHAYENIAAGLGNPALMVFLMRLCDVKFKAAHFAIGTAVMSLGSTVIGGFGGVIVEHFGYVNLFIMGFIAAMPSMALLFWLPMEEPRPQ